MGHREHASAGRPTLEPWAASPSRYLAAPAARPDAPRARIRSCRVARRLPWITTAGGGRPMRVVGLDIHRVFAEAVMLDDGGTVRLGRIGMTREHLDAFARKLRRDDHVVIEATGNATAVAEVIRPHVGRVVIANPRRVRLIAEARIKTDVIDATVLAPQDGRLAIEVWGDLAAILALGQTPATRRRGGSRRISWCK